MSNVKTKIFNLLKLLVIISFLFILLLMALFFYYRGKGYFRGHQCYDGGTVELDNGQVIEFGRICE